MADDLDRLARDLNEVPPGMLDAAKAAMSVTSRNVKDGWRKQLEGSRTVPQGASSITYDVKVDGVGLVSEIGPVLGRGQASIVGITEVGSASNVSPRGYGLKALHDNEADFENGIDAAVKDTLRDLGF